MRLLLLLVLLLLLLPLLLRRAIVATAEPVATPAHVRVSVYSAYMCLYLYIFVCVCVCVCVCVSPTRPRADGALRILRLMRTKRVEGGSNSSTRAH
jgi:hypothetical protein